MRHPLRKSAIVGLSLLLLAPVAHGQSVIDKAKTRQFLLGLQAANGGFAVDTKDPTPTLRGTVTALRGLHYWGGETPNRDKIVNFVLRCRDPRSGGFADTPGQKPSVVPTAVGILAAVELKIAREEYKPLATKFLDENAKGMEEIRMAAAAYEALNESPPKAREWLEAIAKSRNQDGTWGDGAGISRATGGMASLTLRLHGQLANRVAVAAQLKNGQRSDGGYGKLESPKQSDLDSTYRVVRALVMMQESPADSAKLQAFIEKCRNADGGYGIAPGQASGAPATYYAGILHHWLATPPRP